MTPDVVLLILRIALALGLYAFLGLLLFYLQRDVSQAKIKTIPAPLAHLELFEGENAGLLLPLDRVNLIGRAESNTIQIQDTTVSAQHARLSYQGTQWWLEDLGSRNGTRVNEIEVAQPLVVTYGDVFELGRCSMRLQSGAIIPRSVSNPATIPVEGSMSQSEPEETLLENENDSNTATRGDDPDQPET